MTPTDPTAQRGPSRGRLVGLGLALAGLAIAGGLYLSNGAAEAGECAAQPARAEAVDAAAAGHLAALNGTGQGRGYREMTFVDAEGAPRTLSEFAGKRLLVNFWATWCVPCRAEMPALDAIGERYNSEAFAVLPINLDIGSDGPDKASEFLAEGGWSNLPLYADPSFEAFKRLQTEAVAIGLPTTLLLDEQGCELAVLQGPAEWNSADGEAVIRALLAS